ncbi:uncharacterized protein B0I36DRAFT_214887, partial [Microdochium trichocladiopsis]
RIGRRMFWASNRMTERTEDRAYSLLGIFDISLTMLYGEGDRAFARLQEEILKCNEDASILVWSYQEEDTTFAPSGLAPSPSHFRTYTGLVGESRPRGTRNKVCIIQLDLQMTPGGLLATRKVWPDPFDNHKAYAIIAEAGKRVRRPQKVLLIPVLYTTPVQKGRTVRNCVRYATPLWVLYGVVKTAMPNSLCFVRRARDVRPTGMIDGFSLTSMVWAEFKTTFSYPVQTQSHRRHFPDILRGSARGKQHRPVERTFFLQLQHRKEPGCQVVILADYWIDGARIAQGTKVSV